MRLRPAPPARRERHAEAQQAPSNHADPGFDWPAIGLVPTPHPPPAAALERQDTTPIECQNMAERHRTNHRMRSPKYEATLQREGRTLRHKRPASHPCYHPQPGMPAITEDAAGAAATASCNDGERLKLGARSASPPGYVLSTASTPTVVRSFRCAPWSREGGGSPLRPSVTAHSAAMGAQPPSDRHGNPGTRHFQVSRVPGQQPPSMNWHKYTHAMMPTSV